jgi:hypothetical protein
MDVLVKNFKVKELPLVCFDGIYEGGKKEAMKRRRVLLDKDPVRQERKRLKRLEELKTKMEELQKKKEDKKRRRDEVEMEELQKEVKEEQAAADSAAQADMDMNEETNELESALDTMNEGKTREEAETDRQKLLAGELIEEGAAEVASDDEEAMYMGDGARQAYVVPKAAGAAAAEEEGEGENETKPPRNKRFLPVSDERADMLRQLGYPIVSDEEREILEPAMPPWLSTPAEDKPPAKAEIVFREKFDIVELDAKGHVIDKGDEDFQPSKSWTGRMAGFEFKLGDRGLGYYRTGKAVVVPSNTAY